MSIDISIVIPAYNEETRLGATLVAYDDECARLGRSYEIVVVDDGSTDGTVALVQRMARERAAIRCVATRPNRGKGHAVRVGMLTARGRVRLMVDADGSIPAEEIPTVAVPVLARECDVAIGSRYLPGSTTSVRQPWWRRAWSRVANLAVRATLVPGVADTQCGFKAFSARAADDLFSRATVNGWSFDLEVLALASRLGYQVRELPIEWRDDARSRVSPVRDLTRVVREWWAIRANLRRGTYGQLGAGPDLDPSASLSLPAA